MPRYLILWGLEPRRIPEKPKDRVQLWTPMVQMVREGMKSGVTKDWGAFVGERRGYSVGEGTEVEVANMLQQYVPFVHFTTRPVLTLDENDRLMEEMAK